MSAFASAGYVNDKFHFVGLSNYRSVFSSESDPAFWPRKVRVDRFKTGDPLSKASAIPIEEFEENFQVWIQASEDRAVIESLYRKDGDFYVLDPNHFPRKGQKFAIAGELIELEDVGDFWEPFLDEVESAGLDGRPLDIQATAQSTIPVVREGTIGSESMAALERGAEELFETARLKRILNENWFVESRRMGVLLFTVFFSFFNVLLMNLSALLIALALDQKIKTKNILRSVFLFPTFCP